MQVQYELCFHSGKFEGELFSFGYAGTMGSFSFGGKDFPLLSGENMGSSISLVRWQLYLFWAGFSKMNYNGHRAAVLALPEELA